MQKITLQPIKEVNLINGIPFPKNVDIQKLIITGPPGSGKTTIVKSIGGWPEEGYLDISSKEWWKSPVLAHKPRELHFGVPFKGYAKAVPVYELQSLDDASYLEPDLFRIPLPPPKQNFFSTDFRSKITIEFLLLPAKALFELRTKRATEGSHYVDRSISLKQVEEEVSLYNTLALFFHQSGMNVYVRNELGGRPGRIIDDEKHEIELQPYANNLYQMRDQLKLRQRILNRSWSVRGNNELLALFVRLIPDALNVQRCNIFLNDQSQNKVWLICGTALSGKQVVASNMRPLVKQVIEEGTYIVKENMHQELSIDEQNDFVLHNTLLVPIQSVMENKTTGVIQLLNKHDNTCFDEDDRQLLEKVALHLQLAMENIYLRQEMMDFSDILSHKNKYQRGVYIVIGSLIMMLAVSLWFNASLSGTSFLDIINLLP